MSLQNPSCTHPLCSCKEFCKRSLGSRDERESAIPPNEAWASIPYLDRRAMQESARPPNSGAASLPMDPISVLTYALYKLSRAEIVQEIRELDAMKYKNPVLAELCFHRINELLDMLDRDE